MPLVVHPVFTPTKISIIILRCIKSVISFSESSNPREKGRTQFPGRESAIPETTTISKVLTRDFYSKTRDWSSIFKSLSLLFYLALRREFQCPLPITIQWRLESRVDDRFKMPSIRINQKKGLWRRTLIDLSAVPLLERKPHSEPGARRSARGKEVSLVRARPSLIQLRRFRLGLTITTIFLWDIGALAKYSYPIRLYLV